jgi:hypothetical protein
LPAMIQLRCAVTVTLALMAWISHGQRAHPDLEQWDNPLGVVSAVSSNAELRIKRTNNGKANGYCRVKLVGVVLRTGKNKQKAVDFLRRRLLGKEVRFRIHSRTDSVFTAMVLATDLKNGSDVNGYLVYMGLADTDRTDLQPFKFALQHAKAKKIGIWSGE